MHEKYFSVMSFWQILAQRLIRTETELAVVVSRSTLHSKTAEMSGNAKIAVEKLRKTTRSGAFSIVIGGLIAITRTGHR